MTGVMVLLVKSEVSGSVFKVINFILLMPMCLFFKVLSFQKLTGNVLNFFTVLDTLKYGIMVLSGINVSPERFG